MLQLCVGTWCLVFQVLQAGLVVPEVLRTFLEDEGHIFVGAHISKDVDRLDEDFGINVTNTHDLQEIVPNVDKRRLSYLTRGPHGRACLEKVASGVLGLRIWKDKNFDHRYWAVRNLSFKQVEYAAQDAYVL